MVYLIANGLVITLDSERRIIREKQTALEDKVAYLIVGGIGSKVVSIELPLWIVIFHRSSSNTAKVYRSDVIAEMIPR